MCIYSTPGHNVVETCWQIYFYSNLNHQIQNCQVLHW